MERCGAKTRTGGRCRKSAGWGTDHRGDGRCRLHGGATPIKSGRYSKIRRPELAEAIASFADDPDPLDVLPELAGVRALLARFIEHYDEIVDALRAWNAAEVSENPGARPQRLPALDDAIGYLNTCAAIAQREKKLQLDSAVSRKDLLRILTEMTRVVEREVDGADTQKRIRDGWASIQLA